MKKHLEKKVTFDLLQYTVVCIKAMSKCCRALIPKFDGAF